MKSWANIDQPFEVRTVDNFLFAFKRMLLGWGYGKKEVLVDADVSHSLSVAGTKILQPKIENNVLKPIWCDDLWAQWKELQETPEFAQLVLNANERLARSQSFADEGKGKSKGSAH